MNASFRRQQQEGRESRIVPLLDPLPGYLETAVTEWNQRLFQSISHVLAREGTPDCSPPIGSTSEVSGSDNGDGDGDGTLSKQFGGTIRQAQLLLEAESMPERVSPAIEGLSGHAFGYVASGINKHNLRSLFAPSSDALPFLDPRDLAIKSKNGFLLHLLFSKANPSSFLAASGEISLLIDRIRVKYGVSAWSLEIELSGVRSALNAVQRWVEHCVPLKDSTKEDPMKKVLANAITRLNELLKVVSTSKFTT